MICAQEAEMLSVDIVETGFDSPTDFVVRFSVSSYGVSSNSRLHVQGDVVEVKCNEKL
jgi:hypothetical protein